ncbi:MAG: hypothetical protein WCO18_01475, partial [bacterium]
VYMGRMTNIEVGYGGYDSADPEVHVIDAGPMRLSPDWRTLQSPVVLEVGLDIDRYPSALAVSIVSDESVNPILVTTTDNHGLVSGNYVFISGVTGNTAANGYHGPVTKVGATSFSFVAAGDGDYAGGGVVYPAVTEAVGFEMNAFTKDAGTYVRDAYGVKLNAPGVGSNSDLALDVVTGLRIPLDDVMDVDGEICILTSGVSAIGLGFRAGSTFANNKDHWL